MTKVIKGRAVAEFLALNAVEGEEQWNLEFPDENLALIECREWKLYFDGAVNNKGAGLGVILATPEGETIPMAKKLDFKVTNNMAEYEACIYGVEAALAAGAKDLLVYGDSLLIISQANEEWEVKKERLKPYRGYLKTLMKGFDKCLFIHLSRDENQMADALAMLSFMWDRPTGTTIKPLVIMKTRAPCYGGESVMST